MWMSEGGNKDFIATTIIIIVNVKHKRKQTEITEGLIFESTKRNFEKNDIEWLVVAYLLN